MNILLQIFLILVPLIAHLVHDVPEINKGKSPAHAWDALFIAIIALGMGFMAQAWAVPHIYWWQYMIMALTVHFLLFNYALNLLRIPRKPFFYLGDGPWDSLLAALGNPIFVIFFQFIIFLFAYGVYVHLDWIVN